MKEEELKQMDKEELLGVIKAQQYEIERLNNIINEAIIFLKSIGYDEEIGRIWNDMNDDECTDLLKILKGSDKVE